VISSWLVHTVTRKRRTGVGVKGAPVYGAATTHSARVEKTRKIVRSSDGRELVIEYEMAMLDEVKEDDQFWFPSINGEPADDTSNNDKARVPKFVQTARDKSGLRGFWRAGF
jgi:hypothetical protein